MEKESGRLRYSGQQGYDLQWGAASSPVLVDDKIVLQCDQKKGAFLVVLNAADGKELWRLRVTASRTIAGQRPGSRQAATRSKSSPTARPLS